MNKTHLNRLLWGIRSWSELSSRYAMAKPLLMLSKCSFALMRSVAIELDRISVLFMVIFSAISFPVTWLMSMLLSLSSSFLSFGPVIFCGDDELDDNIRELLDDEGKRLPPIFWFGDNDKFCGDETGGRPLCIEDDGDDGMPPSDPGIDDIIGGGNCIWFGGVWRWPANIWFAIVGPCGDDRRILWGCMAAIPCGEMRKLDAFPWCDNANPDMVMFDGAKLSGGVR